MSSSVDVLTPKVVVGLIMGTWLPYGFSAMTMESVGRAGFKMALEVREQLLEFGPELIGVYRTPNYAKCFEIATEASFRGVIGPVALVIFTPLIVGIVFGVETLSGLLAGSLSSVVQIAVSASKTDGAWNQAKEDIKAGALEYAKTHCRDEDLRRLLKIAEEGKTIGGKRKDTSGPPLNILVQLMAIESLVFAPFFASYGGLLFKFL
ncbi:hypothetical protein BT93_C1068 [Corymbia citriodora subsp. variegata]|nr:hypothetical protein BT93_C1068 [Corymbia citriodora subsp. variegata]